MFRVRRQSATGTDMSASPSVPTVSVVVPCYNGGAYIDGLLAALAMQTFRDFEIVVVDDGSTDPETKRKLGSLDPAVRVLRQANGGPAAARNRGIREARAELILTIDADDVIRPSYLAETVAALRAAGAETGFAATYEEKAGRWTGINNCYFKLFDQLFTNRIPSCILMRKSAWEKVGGYDERMREGYEDWEFLIALGRAGYRCAIVPKPLFVYWMREDGHWMTDGFGRHAMLWRRIREKHHEMYRPAALLRLWWSSRLEPGTMTLSRAVVLLAMAKFLPDAWVHAIRAYRLNRGQAALGASH